MKHIARSILGVSLAVILAGPALAQGSGGRGGFGGGLGMLLGNASVQKELKLEASQIEKAKELTDKIGEKMTAAREQLQGADQEERRTKLMELNRENNEMVLKTAGEFLKPEQITRLKQISLHQRGAMAFEDEEVAKKLALTDAQKSEIKSIVDDSRTEMRSIFQDNQDDPEARRKKMTELRAQTLAKAAAKLNDEQQKTWKELLGAPFEVKYERPAN